MEHIAEKALRRLQVRCRQPVEHLLAGEYRSVFKGRGVEFDELKEYSPGDDVRMIDWRSLARTGRPYIRRYIEEREQSFILAVDVSGSAFFGSGSRTKIQAAYEAVAMLAWSATRNHDRVGLLLFTTQIEKFIPPAHGRNHILNLLSELLRFTPTRTGTDIPQALEFISRVVRKRGIVFLFSDFISSDYEMPLRLLAQRHDLTAVRMTDPAEQRLPTGCLVELRDAETQQSQLVDTSALDALSPDVAQRLEKTCRESDIDYLELSSQSDCAEALSAYFHHRRNKVKQETGG